MVNYAEGFKNAIESKNPVFMREAMIDWQSDSSSEDDANYWLAFSMVCSLSDLNEKATKAIYKANSLTPNDSDLHNWYYRQANDLKTYTRRNRFNNPFMEDLVMKDVEL